MKKKLSIFAIAFMLIAAMIPFTVAADEFDDAGWGDSAYVLGRQITSENCTDVLGDGGSVQYDLNTRTLTLTNAALDLANYQSDADENNTVYGIEAFRNLNLVLVGENKIISTAEQFTEEKEYVYGISVSDELVISGSGSLDISIHTAQNGIQAFYGIDSTRKLTVDGANLNIKMSGDGKNTGIHAGFRGYELKGNSAVSVVASGENGIAVYDWSFAGSPIEAGSSIEMTSDHIALEYIRLNASVEERGALVNHEATAEGAVEWDGTTRLDTYKYVKLPASDSESGERGFKDNVYILGTLITEDNCGDVLEDGGSVKYDFDTHTLTLTNASLDLNQYYMDPSVENNYVAGINAFGEINIELVGENRIFNTNPGYAEDKEYSYGITGQDAINLIGSGSLNIEVNTENAGIEFRGIDSMNSVSVAGPVLDIGMKGSGKSTGIDLNRNGFALRSGSEIHVYTGGVRSIALYDRSFAASVIEDGTVLELSSDNIAFRYYTLSDSFQTLGAMVNTAATPEGAAEWDKTTRLDKFKYVRVPAVTPADDGQGEGTIDGGGDSKNPPTDKSSDNSKKAEPSIKTGDENNMILWVVLALGCLAGGSLAATIYFRPKKNKR